jgi:hypothetical protein
LKYTYLNIAAISGFGSSLFPEMCQHNRSLQYHQKKYHCFRLRYTASLEAQLEKIILLLLKHVSLKNKLGT